MSSFDISKGDTKQMVENLIPNPVSIDRSNSRDTLFAKRRLKLTIRTKANEDLVVDPGDLVHINILGGH